MTSEIDHRSTDSLITVITLYTINTGMEPETRVAFFRLIMKCRPLDRVPVL